ncbi:MULTISPECIES: acyl-CoA synthetase [unclassified Variovorax]|uniref:acyl-CoA synthetase n=1 Tax=unclassified Variovorax TaxID=663243 RepID=UPI001BD2D1CE|nr:MULTISPECIES: AMP-binding protein [unclassified Variovorax]
MTPDIRISEIISGNDWRIPTRLNFAAAVCDRHAIATPEAPAVIFEAEDGKSVRYNFRQLDRAACRVANMLAAYGVKRGDQVMIMQSQSVEAVLTYVACMKMGAVFVPISTMYGEVAISERASAADVCVIVADKENYPKLVNLKAKVESLRAIFLVDGEEAGAIDFGKKMLEASDEFQTVDTAAEEVAYICYTSGSTGAPKAVMHAHRFLLANIPGFSMLHNNFGQEGDVMWSPADWSWGAGIIAVLLPTLWHGKPIVACRPKSRFDAEHAFALMSRHGVRNAFLIPTMLRMLQQVRKKPSVKLRSFFSGGEMITQELVDWSSHEFGVLPNEGYGQTECNMVLAHLPQLISPRYGSLGKPFPGMTVMLQNADGSPTPVGEIGEITVRAPSPLMLLDYWKNPQATAEKMRGGWFHSNDLARVDEEGYFWFAGRNDDVIKTSGYRVGSAEIESCLTSHPEVAAAVAIGVPDALRGQIIKAFVIPRDEALAGEALKASLKSYVAEGHAKHFVPSEIEFVDSLPVTTSGKVERRTLREREIRNRALAANLRV